MCERAGCCAPDMRPGADACAGEACNCVVEVSPGRCAEHLMQVVRNLKFMNLQLGQYHMEPNAPLAPAAALEAAGVVAAAAAAAVAGVGVNPLAPRPPLAG